MVRSCYFLLALLLSSVYVLMATESSSSSNEDISELLNELNTQIQAKSITFNEAINLLEQELNTTNQNLKTASTTDEMVRMLFQRMELEEDIKQVNNRYISDISKIRYLKGLQIIKILYEKTLSLDHHFATVSTLNEINKISNPNQYEDFRNVKDLLEKDRDKKTGFSLSTLLGDNIYTSVVHSLVSLFSNNQVSKTEKEKSLQQVECILDFTLRMNNDLNTIYFETAFLQKSNETVMKDLEQLFRDYTQPIRYTTELKKCRENDDWSLIRGKLNTYLETLETTIESNTEDNKIRSMQINLQFPIDRLLQFITQYNSFIDQGSKFYEKFDIMLNSYENEQQCSSKIPVAYKTLKKNISLSIDKFNTAYKPIEINGSKLKQLLYGINEYE